MAVARDEFWADIEKNCLTMNRIIISFLIILLVSCRHQTNVEFNEFRVIAITINEENIVNIGDNKALSDRILQNIVNAEIIKGPIKGIGIEIILSKQSDTIKILSYGGSKHFSYDRKNYKANINLLPDSIVSKLIEHLLHVF